MPYKRISAPTAGCPSTLTEMFEEYRRHVYGDKLENHDMTCQLRHAFLGGAFAMNGVAVGGPAKETPNRIKAALAEIYASNTNENCYECERTGAVQPASSRKGLN